MTKTKTLAVVGSALVLMMSMPVVATAQTSNRDTQDTPSSRANQDEPPAQEARGRIRQNRRSNEAPPAPTPEENLAAAQAVATSAGNACQVSQASLLGQTETGPMYEATCATGPGHIFVASTPPQAIDCVQLASSAVVTRERDPAADVGMQCSLPGNAEILPVLAVYAQSATVPCTPDEGLAIGKAPNGNLIYEVGCAGQDGYWLEQTGTTFTKTECIQVVGQNGKCRFTTPQEQAATLKTWLAGSPAAACDVQQARYMGGNANGSFYEAKCAAGDGYVARVNAEKAVQQTYPCTEAQRIGGGCTLTQVPAAPTAATPAPAAAE